MRPHTKTLFLALALGAPLPGAAAPIASELTHGPMAEIESLGGPTPGALPGPLDEVGVPPVAPTPFVGGGGLLPPPLPAVAPAAPEPPPWTSVNPGPPGGAYPEWSTLPPSAPAPDFQPAAYAAPLPYSSQSFQPAAHADPLSYSTPSFQPMSVVGASPAAPEGGLSLSGDLFGVAGARDPGATGRVADLDAQRFAATALASTGSPAVDRVIQRFNNFFEPVLRVTRPANDAINGGLERVKDPAGTVRERVEQVKDAVGAGPGPDTSALRDFDKDPLLGAVRHHPGATAAETEQRRLAADRYEHAREAMRAAEGQPTYDARRYEYLLRRAHVQILLGNPELARETIAEAEEIEGRLRAPQ